jgi:dinuclear metal center YbgI/SA1388 family protein
MQVKELVDHLNNLLNVSDYEDYCPIGLQVEGSDEVSKIITGVTACQALLDRAVKEKADAVLVHHGYFWKGESPAVVGMKAKRLKTLLTNNINLIAYHLPLDGNDEFGNNTELAKLMDWKITGDMELSYGKGVGRIGELNTPLSAEALAKQFEEKLHRQPLYIAANDQNIKTIAWCTGGAQDCLKRAAELGVDAYVTGEASEYNTHQARELGIHFFAAGHHATERYGVKALGEHLAEKFGLAVEFVDIPNPI